MPVAVKELLSRISKIPSLDFHFPSQSAGEAAYIGEQKAPTVSAEKKTRDRLSAMFGLAVDGAVISKSFTERRSFRSLEKQGPPPTITAKFEHSPFIHVD